MLRHLIEHRCRNVVVMLAHSLLTRR
jgi:hypothetical protein